MQKCSKNLEIIWWLRMLRKDLSGFDIKTTTVVFICPNTLTRSFLNILIHRTKSKISDSGSFSSFISSWAEISCLFLNSSPSFINLKLSVKREAFLSFHSAATLAERGIEVRREMYLQLFLKFIRAKKSRFYKILFQILSKLE